MKDTVHVVWGLSGGGGFTAVNIMQLGRQYWPEMWVGLPQRWSLKWGPRLYNCLLFERPLSNALIIGLERGYFSYEEGMLLTLCCEPLVLYLVVSLEGGPS